MTDQEFLLEKEKLKLSKFQFWFVSVAIGLITLIINFTIQYKQLRIQQIENENTYLSNFVDDIMDKDLEKRKDIALYFSNVSLTSSSRIRWNNYFNKIDELIKYKLQLQKELNDNINKINEYSDLIINNSDSVSLIYIDSIKYLIDSNVLKKQELLTLESSYINNDSLSILKQYELMSFDFMILKDYNSVMNYLTKIEKINPYYNSNYEIKKLFDNKKNKLHSDSIKNWKTIYKSILNEYEYCLTEETKTKFKNSIK